MQTASGNATAAGVVTFSLIDLLVSKGVLRHEDVLTVLENARQRLVPFGYTPDTAAAQDAISSLAQMYAAKGDR